MDQNVSWLKPTTASYSPFSSFTITISKQIQMKLEPRGASFGASVTLIRWIHPEKKTRPLD